MITTDPWILKGDLKIPFVCQPRQWRKRHTKAKSKVDTSSMKEIISMLQLKGAIKPDQLHRHAASSAEREAPNHSGRMQKGLPESFYVDDRASALLGRKIHCTQMGLAQTPLHSAHCKDST